MAVIKANVQSEFLIVSNSVAQDASLSLEARGMILLMGSRPAGWKFSKSELMTNAGVGRDKLNRIFSELTKHGHLAIVQNHDESGRFIDADYHFFTEPTQNPAFIEVSPCTEKPYTAKPYNGKSAPINKESYKKKDNKNINAFFDVFWNNWRVQKKRLGITNYGSKQEALKKFKLLFGRKTEKDWQDIVNGCLTKLEIVIDDLLKNPTGSQYFNYRNMYPQKFLGSEDWLHESE